MNKIKESILENNCGLALSMMPSENGFKSSILNAMEEYHQAKLKLMDVSSNVSQRSELIDFMNFLFDNWQPRKHLTAKILVDGYLKSIGS